MKQIVARLFVGVALVALTAIPAAAQDNDLGAGLTLQTWNSDFAGSKGFGIDFARAIRKSDTRVIAIVVDFARNRFTDEETDTSILGGVRIKLIRSQRIALFLQALAGMMHWSEDGEDSGTQPMFGGGGGVQVKLSEMMDFKGQFDLFGSDGDLITRIWAGIVFRFGAK